MIVPKAIAYIIAASAIFSASCDWPAEEESGAGRRPASSIAEQSADTITGSLAGRRQWSVNEVKVDLATPDLAVALSRSDTETLRVEAWRASNNDFHVPMMRVDGGELLYALSDEEYADLARRAAGTSR